MASGRVRSGVQGECDGGEQGFKWDAGMAEFTEGVLDDLDNFFRKAISLLMTSGGENVSDAHRFHKGLPEIGNESWVAIGDDRFWERDTTAVPIFVVYSSHVGGSGGGFARG